MTWTIAVVSAAILAAITALLWLASIGRGIRLREAAEGTKKSVPQHEEYESELDPFPLATAYVRAQNARQSEPGPIARAIRNLIGALLSGLPFLAGLVLIALQIFGWLRSGEWLPVNVLVGLSIFWNSPWIASPQDWIGLHSILSRLPLSGTLIALGCYFYWAAFIAKD
jgi:hypothetical protein